MQEFDSKSKQDRFNKEINALAVAYIAEKLCPELNELLSQEDLGLSAAINPSDGHTIDIRYPATFSEAYIRPEVRLEIGPLASWVPADTHIIRPYAYDVLPRLFQDPECRVIAIAAERTFWEKATILHQEAHRQTPIPQRYSRHYYDLYKLSVSPVGATALANPKLLQDVVEFKRRFYPAAWARYDLAVPGNFRLLPGNANLRELEQDYAGMQVMLFGDAPKFGAIIDELRTLEARINAMQTTPKVLSLTSGA